MPRKPRFYLPSVPVHIVQRGHSRSPIFFESQDYATYAHWLKEAGEKYSVSIHAFVLMTNHVHLLITAEKAENISRFMQFIGRRYVPYINHKYGRSGSLWEGRYKASLVQKERYFLTVMRYIELNPVRASMVDLPGHYRWSSFVHNAGMRKISFIKYHSAYLSLASDEQQRYRLYRNLFIGEIGTEDITRIRESWQTGTPLGSSVFKGQVEQALACKVGQARRGRPKGLVEKGL